MSGVSFILEKFWLNSGWNDDKIWLGQVIKQITLCEEYYSIPWLQEDNE